MSGGSSNRIVSITFSSQRFILRVRRLESDTYHQDVALLEYLSRRLTFSVPTVKHFDVTSDSPLQSPYIMQYRIPGERFDKVWPRLSHHQQCMVALDMARFYKELATITNPSHGVPDATKSTADGTSNDLVTMESRFWIDPTRKVGRSGRVNPPLSGAEALYRRLERWEERWNKHRDDYTFAKALVAAQKVQEADAPFGSDGDKPLHYLCHGDLFPRNFMVHVPVGTDTAYLSGLLDWDDAHFGPPIIALAPPAWMWLPTYFDEDSEDGEGEDGLTSEFDVWGPLGSVEPVDEHCKEIKRLFDTVAGDGVTRHMYAKHAHFARKMWYQAHQELASTWGAAAVRECVEQLEKEGFLTGDWFPEHEEGEEGSDSGDEVASNSEGGESSDSESCQDACAAQAK